MTQPDNNSNGMHTTTAELYRLYNAYNHKFWNRTLPTAQITVQKADSRSIRATAWCSTAKIWQPYAVPMGTTGDQGRYEINLIAEQLSRHVHLVAVTLLHEMVHLANSVHGIRDCSSHQYHNKHFKDEAERVWLHVDQVPKYGFAATKATPQLLEWLGQEPLNPDAFTYYRLGLSDPTLPRGSKTKMKKWRCGCTNVRCAVDLQAICTNCNKPFTRQDTK